ncbi:hypothetical protein GCM10009424_25230 [Sphingomonas ursincola]
MRGSELRDADAADLGQHDVPGMAFELGGGKGHAANVLNDRANAENTIVIPAKAGIPLGSAL